MIITRIEYQKKNINRVSIYIDNKFAFGLTDEIRYKYNLKVDDVIEQEFIDDILKAEELNKVIYNALNLLSYRQRSEKEIYDSLKRKGFDDANIDKAIEYLKSYKYLDDNAFATSFINDKKHLNKLGSTRIKYELIKKGVSKEIIETTLEIDSDEEYEVALELASKKINNYKGQDKNAIYRKLGGFLQRKGYPYDVVSKVLRNLLKD